MRCDDPSLATGHFSADCGAGGCGEACVNRQLMMECPIGYCEGGAEKQGSKSDNSDAQPRRRLRTNDEGSRLPCANTVIQRSQYPPCEIFDTGTERGFGLRCQVDTKPGTILGEYRGEIITADELARRRDERDPTTPFYFAALGEGLYIDAEKRGAYARFANHSCDPNCALEKWTVGHEPRLVLVAMRYIPKRTELSYDYNAGGGVADATRAQACRCGAENCAGTIGAKVRLNDGPAPKRLRTLRTAPVKRTQKSHRPRASGKKPSAVANRRIEKPTKKGTATRRHRRGIDTQADGPTSETSPVVARSPRLNRRRHRLGWRRAPRAHRARRC